MTAGDDWMCRQWTLTVPDCSPATIPHLGVVQRCALSADTSIAEQHRPGELSLQYYGTDHAPIIDLISTAAKCGGESRHRPWHSRPVSDGLSLHGIGGCDRIVIDSPPQFSVGSPADRGIHRADGRQT